MLAEFFRQYPICIILLIIGLVFLFITYIGAPLESKRKGKFVSGVPMFGGICIAAAFLITPYKWLALLGLLDWQIFWFVFKVIPENFLYERNLKNRPFPETINDEKIIMHTNYKQKYGEVHKPDENVIHILPICYYAICECEAKYALISLDVNFQILKKEIFHTIEDCKNSVGKKIKWVEM